MAVADVKVRGLDEFVDGVAKLETKISEMAPDRFDEIAEIATSAVRVKMPRRSGKLAASVRKGRRKNAVLVRVGKAKVPYAGWIEYGGNRVGRGGGIASRPIVKGGRYLYPTALELQPQLIKVANQGAKDEIKEMRWERPT